MLFHAQQLLALAFQHPFDRHAGPARDHLCDVIGGNGLVDHGTFALGRFDALEPLFQLGNAPVGEFARALVFTLALRIGEFYPQLIELGLELLRLRELLLLGFPSRGDVGRLLFQRAQLLFQPLEPFLRAEIGLFLERLLLDAQPDDLAIERIELLWLRIDLHLQARRRFVDEIDRLVRQKAVGDVAVRQRRCGDDRAVGDAHAVVLLVAILEPAQDRDRVLHVRLVDIDRLETTGERSVLLDVFLVLVECGRADAVQLAARERRL